MAGQVGSKITTAILNAFTPAVKMSSDLTVENDIIPNNIVGYISNTELKNIVAASTDFADFKTRIAALP